WTASSITVTVPPGATTGNVVVNASGVNTNGVSFAVTTIPTGWTDADVGTVGLAGSATYSNNVFTVQGSGLGMSGTADGMHFVYQPLTGDGTIVARVVSSGSAAQAGVMIRETLNANA